MIQEATIHSGPYDGGNYEHHWAGPFLDAHLISDIGKKRPGNEDACAAAIPGDGGEDHGVLFVVADGMGGVRGGAHASRSAVDTICARYYGAGDGKTNGHAEDILRAAVEEANSRILAEAGENPGLKGMGTTASVVVVRGAQAYVAQVGDSRVYLAHGDGSFKQLTDDHSFVAEQLRLGVIDEEQARHHTLRNLITRALGARDDVDVDMFTAPLREGDSVLLCSDGLSNMVDDSEIRETLTGGCSTEQAARNLVQRALENGAPDNVTAVVIRVTAEPPRFAAANGVPRRHGKKDSILGRLRRLIFR